MALEHEEAVPRYPLQWPLGWARKRSRRAGQFTESVTAGMDDAGVAIRRQRSVSMATAVDRLEIQLTKLGANSPTLSTNVKLNLRGLPYGNEQPSDPGVAVYFRYKGRATVLACDTYYTVADNIAAIAAHVDALRRIDRYGVGSLEQALAGYRALPADSAADWRAVFGLNGSVTAEQVQDAYRERAKSAHPDKGGNDEMMMHINRARDFALQEILNG